MTQSAVQGMPGARTEDRGDGFLTVIPPNVSTARVIDQLLKELPSALELITTPSASLPVLSCDWL